MTLEWLNYAITVGVRCQVSEERITEFVQNYSFTDASTLGGGFGSHEVRPVPPHGSTPFHTRLKTPTTGHQDTIAITATTHTTPEVHERTADHQLERVVDQQGRAEKRHGGTSVENRLRGAGKEVV